MKKAAALSPGNHRAQTETTQHETNDRYPHDSRRNARARLHDALVFAVASVQARPTHTAGSRAATAALSDCTIVITGAPWRIRAHVAGGSLAGDRYTLKARNVSCSSLRAWVAMVTKQRNPGFGAAIKGPPGFSCQSFTPPFSGAKLVAEGECTHGPHNNPFFGWAPKVPGH